MGMPFGGLCIHINQQRMLIYRGKPKNEADLCREVEKRSNGPLCSRGGSLVPEGFPPYEESRRHLPPLMCRMILPLQPYTKFFFTLS